MLSLPFVIAIAAAILFTPGVRAIAARTGAVDRPDGNRKRQMYPVPTLGGLAVCCAILLSAAVGIIQGALADGLIPVLLAAATISLIGAYDDIRNLRPRLKFIGQIVAVLPIAVLGDSFDRFSLLGQVVHIGVMGRFVTVLWLVSGINAVNFLDGMDGLGALTGLSISLAAAAIAWFSGQAELALLALIHAGALIGFMVYNLPPARVYLGDSGSMLIGLIVSYLALHVPRDSSGTLHLGTAVALLTIPILDTFLAIIRRTLVGQDFWHGDRRHLHHCLLSHGMSIWKALRYLAGLFCITGFCSFIAEAWNQPAVAWGAFFFVPTYLYSGNYCCRLEWELAKKWMRRSVKLLSNRA